MEHLKIAYALEFLESCQIPRNHINFLRTDAIILSTPKKKMQLAKQGLVNVTRETLCKPKAWLFKRDTVLEQSAGQGEIFRVFNCELPVQEKMASSSTRSPDVAHTSCHPCKSSVKESVMSRSWL